MTSLRDRFRRRSAKSGRFTTAADAEANPDMTVVETENRAIKEAASLRWRVDSLESAALMAAGDIRNALMHHSDTPDRLSAIATRLEEAARDRIPKGDTAE